MAGTSLFTLIDDIATLLDDVAVLTKVATRKTAGVLGDDLALNAEQVTGVRPKRELPVVWAVFKGSALNKLILVPAALAVSAFAPWAITPALMFGGAFLCYEGFEKVAHKFLHTEDEDAAHHGEHLRAVADEKVDLVAFEKGKIRGAIRTDFVLSAEIVVITLGAAAEAPLVTRALVLASIATLMTVGVYGLVACIVKLDDVGLSLSQRDEVAARKLGVAILRAAPWFMKGLSVVGTAAMFLVGGGILVHGIEPLHHFAAHYGGIVETAIGAATGIAAGAILVGAKKWGQAPFQRNGA